MDPAVIAAISGLVGAIVGAAAVVIVSIVNNRHQLRQQREQWDREKLKSDEEQKRHDRKRLQDIYANAVHSLSEAMMIVNHEKYKQGYMEKDLPAKIGEIQRYVSLIAVEYYGDPEDTAFKTFFTSLISLSPNDSGFSGYIDHLRHCVIGFAKNDPRLK